MSRPPGMLNISRHDSAKTRGWEVHVKRGDVVLWRHFADSGHGGKSKALAAAKAYRDELLPKLPPASPVKFKNTRNTTGVVGVCYHAAAGTYIAHWPEGGRPHSQRFSVAKYGAVDAFALAVAARQEALERIGAVSDRKAHSKRCGELPAKQSRKRGRKSR